MCIGSRHGFPSHHLRFARASPAHGDSMFADIRTRENSYAFGAKSSGPKIWRISVSPSQPGQCFL
jgi:hypothetical protein